jgi:hypothetical protein
LKKVFALIILILIMFALSNPVSASTILNSTNATYYISPNGNDSNNGLTPDKSWLSPNHALNCGDTILALPGNYSAGNFGSGKWGTVACPSNNNVAWLKCSVFDGCKIVTNGNDGMRISSSYWGVQGWEITNTNGSCFSATPPTFSPAIHHIIFANNIANGCKSNGFSSYPFYSGKNQGSVDYIEIIGNLVYNAAGGNNLCFSGISIYEPQNTDTNLGTHIYIAQNFAWNNVGGPTCPGNSDGNGIILDDFNGDQSGMINPYSGQTVVENNIVIGNGSAGIAPFHNTKSPVFVLNNTSYGNYTDPYHQGSYKGEILYNWSSNITSKYNITQSTIASNGVGNYPVYAFYVGRGNNTNVADYNWIYSPFGKNTGINSSSGFSYGSHQTIGVNPNFVNPFIPNVPNCTGSLNTIDCMKDIIAGFVPQANGTSGYGYQAINNNFVQNDYYPNWLCNVTMPDGIISNYCNGVINTPIPTNTLVHSDTPMSPTETFIPTDTLVPSQTNTSTPIVPSATDTSLPTFTATQEPSATFTSTPNPTSTEESIIIPTKTIECITVIFSDNSKIIVCKP